MTQDLSSILNPTAFVDCDFAQLEALRSRLAKGLSAPSIQELMASLSFDQVEELKLKAASFCIALIEFNYWVEANQIAAYTLQEDPHDERMIALLAFSLASMGEFEQSRIILGRAIESCRERERQGEIFGGLGHNGSLTPLDVVLSSLEKLITNHESPAEYAFADRPTLNTGAGHNAFRLESFPIETDMFGNGVAEDTLRDLDVSAALALVDEMAESEPTLNLERSNPSISNRKALSPHAFIVDEMDDETSQIPLQHLHDDDTERHQFMGVSDFENHDDFNLLADDHITSILVDIEERERDHDESQDPEFFNNNATSSSSSPHLVRELDTESLSQDSLLIDHPSQGFESVLSEFELMSEYSSSYDSSIIDSSVVSESTERMAGLSAVMFDEERKRIEAILKDEAEPLVVSHRSSGQKASPPPLSISDPLLYPPEAASSLNLSSARKMTAHDRDQQARSWQEATETKLRDDLNAVLPSNIPSSLPPIPSLGGAALPPSSPPIFVDQTPKVIEPPKPSIVVESLPLPPIPKAKQSRVVPQLMGEEKKLPAISQPNAAPLAPPELAEPPVKKSALERLNTQEPEFPTRFSEPTFSSPREAFQGSSGRSSDRPQKRSQKGQNRSQQWRGKQMRTRQRAISWWLFVGLFTGSALSLMGAFHYKSAHLIHELSFFGPRLEWSHYIELEGEAKRAISHPVGRSLDLLQGVNPESSLARSRREVADQHAWFSTALWVFFGEVSLRPTATEAIFRALRSAPEGPGGRAALGLAFFALGQPVAARAIIDALPKEDWRQQLVSAWISFQSDDRRNAIKGFERLAIDYPHNQVSAIALSLLKSNQGLASVQGSLSYLSQELTPEELYPLFRVNEEESSLEKLSDRQINFIRGQAPQVRRLILDRVIPKLMGRGDRIGLQNLTHKLSLGINESGPLLLPSLLVYLSELDFDHAEPIYQQLQSESLSGDVSAEDKIVALLLWDVFSSSPTPNMSRLGAESPKLAQDLGRFAGNQVEELITDRAVLRPKVISFLSAIYSLYDERWSELERVTTSLDGRSVDEHIENLGALAKSFLSKSAQRSQVLIESLNKVSSEGPWSILVQAQLLQGLAFSAVDTEIQGARALQKLSQSTTIPALKWLGDYWRCTLLQKSAAFAQTQSSCHSALELNPRDFKSSQSLAATLLELGESDEAYRVISNVPKHALSEQGRRLALRLNTRSHLEDQHDQESARDLELLSAERELRFDSFNRLIEERISALSRLELYRATWVSDYLGKPSVSDALRRRALTLKSPHARLDQSRMKLFSLVAKGELTQESMSTLVPPALRSEVSPEPSFALFLLSFDALSCLAEKGRLDLHHRHPALLTPNTQPSQLFSALSQSAPPRECRSMITNSLTHLKESDARPQPLIAMTQAQLLISLGQEERAEQLLRSLIEREPSFIEARFSYALLLLRSGRSSVFSDVKWAIEPIMGVSRDRVGAQLVNVIKTRLGER